MGLRFAIPWLCFRVVYIESVHGEQGDRLDYVVVLSYALT